MWCFLEARHIYKYLPFVPIVAYSTAASSSSSPQTENNFRGQYEPLISFCVWTHICRLLSLVVSVKCPVVLSGHINVCVCTAYTHLSSWACHQNHQFSKGPWGVLLFFFFWFFFVTFLCLPLCFLFMFLYLFIIHDNVSTPCPFGCQHCFLSFTCINGSPTLLLPCNFTSTSVRQAPWCVMVHLIG